MDLSLYRKFCHLNAVFKYLFCTHHSWKFRRLYSRMSIWCSTQCIQFTCCGRTQVTTTWFSEHLILKWYLISDDILLLGTCYLGYELAFVRVVLIMSCPGHELSSVWVVLGTSCPNARKWRYSKLQKSNVRSTTSLGRNAHNNNNNKCVQRDPSYRNS